MKLRIIFWGLIVVLALLTFQVRASGALPAIHVDELQDDLLPAEKVLFIEENGEHFTENQILNNIAQSWRPLSADPIFAVGKTYWFKFKLESDLAANYLISPGFWHQGSLYYSQANQPWKKLNTSVFVPLSQRQFASHRPTVAITIPVDGVEIIIKASGFRHGRDPIAQYIKVVKETRYLNEAAAQERVQGGFMGFAVAIVGFHLVLWFWFREKVYLWLVAAMTTAPIFYHAFLGLGFMHFWPEWPYWNEYSASIMSAVVPALYLRFGASYLNLATQLPRINRVVTFIFYSALVSSLAVFYQKYDLLWIQALLTTFASLLILGTSIYLAKRGFRYAWYFIVGNLLVIATLLIWPFVELGNLTMDDFPFSIINFAQFGSAWQGILLSLGMVDRMQSMRQVMLKQELESEKQAAKHAKQTQALINAQNKELESTNQALKELDDLKDDFLARTSHELNTPLNGIIGLSQILLDEDVEISDAEREEYLELIASRGEHLKELVVELLEFVKTRKEVINLYQEDIDISSHVKKIVLTFKKQADDRGLYLNYEEGQSVTVQADARRMRQVLTILLDNALKYTDEGGVTVRIVALEEQAVIEVEDSGVGISKEQQTMIFEPFKQLKHNNRTREGAGLGLSICKHLIELHGGELKIRSKVNQGSKFSISLPYKMSEQQSLEQSLSGL